MEDPSESQPLAVEIWRADQQRSSIGGSCPDISVIESSPAGESLVSSKTVEVSVQQLRYLLLRFLFRQIDGGEVKQRFVEHNHFKLLSLNLKGNNGGG